ncbi:MAG TPA: hypothetical protein PLX79_02760 [Candidatus Dojkabacteria bacterium]|nr:hypothetical protein [Candidatus Dojkabacteria bacterium]
MSEPKYFDVDLNILNNNQKEVVKILLEIAPWVHRIWLKQVDEEKKLSLFYPNGVTAQEIEQASISDPDILSHYTVVKKEPGGLVSVSYREEYKEEIEEIIALLLKASELSEDNVFSKHLKDLAKDFDEGDFDSVIVDYVKTEDGPISLLLGPISSYQDTMFGVKRSFQYNLRVIRPDLTKEVQNMADIAKSGIILKPLSIETSNISKEKIKVSVVDVITFAGRQAGSTPSSTNLPDDADMVKEYGTKIVFYQNSMINKTDTILKPVKRYLPQKLVDIPEDRMNTAYLRMVSLHEISEALLKFKKINERMLGYNDSMRELNAFLMGIKSARYYVINGLFTVQDFNDIKIAFILYGIDAINRRHDNMSIMEYAKGFAIIFNYGYEKGIFTVKENVLHVKMDNMIKLDKLINLVLTIFAEGSYQDVDALFKRYGSFDLISKLFKK